MDNKHRKPSTLQLLIPSLGRADPAAVPLAAWAGDQEGGFPVTLPTSQRKQRGSGWSGREGGLSPSGHHLAHPYRDRIPGFGATFLLVQALTRSPGPEGSFQNKGRACSSVRASAWVWKKSRRSVHSALPAAQGPLIPCPWQLASDSPSPMSRPWLRLRPPAACSSHWSVLQREAGAGACLGDRPALLETELARHHRADRRPVLPSPRRAVLS